MNNLTVVAKFIRVRGTIINVADVVCVKLSSAKDQDGNSKETTKMILKNPHQEERTFYQWWDDIRDEIWDLLQAGSTQHLDPHDRLRSRVVL